MPKGAYTLHCFRKENIVTRNAWAVPAVIVAAMLFAGGCGSTSNSAAPASTSPSSGTAGTGGASSPTPTTPTTTSPSLVDLQNFTVCTNPAVGCSSSTEMVTEPSTLTLSADGSSIMTGISWSGWATATAVGTGTLNVNDCTPDCVSGTSHPYSATVTLTNPEVYGSGLEGYADMSVKASDSSYDQTFSQLVH